MKQLKEKNGNLTVVIGQNQHLFKKIESFLGEFSIEDYSKRKTMIDNKREDLARAVQDMRLESEKIERNKKDEAEKERIKKFYGSN